MIEMRAYPYRCTRFVATLMDRMYDAYDSCVTIDQSVDSLITSGAISTHRYFIETVTTVAVNKTQVSRYLLDVIKILIQR